MPDYLLVSMVDDTIASHTSSETSEVGYRTVDVSSVTITGDQLPSNCKDMVGGTLSESNVYSSPTSIDNQDKMRAWMDATSDWVQSGTMADDEAWKRAVKCGNRFVMTDSDWAALVSAYPAS